MTDLELLPAISTPRRTTLAITAGAAVITAALLSLALFLGNWAFKARSASLHERRLSRAIEQKAQRWQMAEALRAEGMTEVGQARSTAELAPMVERWGAGKRAEILDHARGWPLASVFRTDSVAYFLFFDEGDRLRAFSFVAR
jgi:hypothetical protein